MADISIITVNIFLFLTLYAQVLLLFTFFERKNIFGGSAETRAQAPNKFPVVTIIVPVWNEEKTLAGTINSLLGLDYPKENLDIIIVDDGSKDGTRQVANTFKKHPQVRVFHKENGGKHTAVNLGIRRARGELIGCLDADSFVDKNALLEIVRCFEDDKIMAVTPAIRVHTPGNTLQKIQRVEYNMGIFLRKMFGSMNAIHVTPGPFSIFRKKVFDDLGEYRRAHNTEDMEMALRMHKNYYPIANAYTAYVYTVTPRTVKGLYKQRLRWVYGFLANAIDYRMMIFNKKYGNVGVFTLPAAIVSIIAALYFTSLAVVHFSARLAEKMLEVRTVGMSWEMRPYSFDWFFVNTDETAIIIYILLISTVFIVFTGKKLAEGNMKVSSDMLYFLTLYGFLAPLWLFKAVYNVAFGKKTTWR
ncbi:MAG: glycosyltransferase family 2 protein [Parcubacteria group bacterium]|nr:glycosyltransferase family 2 protein [Parcubacteria group bacterium]